MKRKITLAAVISAFVSVPLFADSTWQGGKGSGYVDDDTMWSSAPAPIYSTVMSSGGRNFAIVRPDSNWVSTMYLKNLSILNGTFSINMWPGYENSLIFDGKDVVFEHGAVPDGMASRPINDVFFCENGNGSDYRYFTCNIGNKTGAAFSWSNAYFRIDHRQHTPGSTDYLDAVNTMTFGRGTFFWGGTNLASLHGSIVVNFATKSGLRNEMVITNSTVFCNQFDWQGMISSSALHVDGESAKLSVLKDFKFGATSSADVPGTNVCTVSNGARVEVNTSNAAGVESSVGSKTLSKQACKLIVSGSGSLFDYSRSSRGFNVYDSGELVITNGGAFNVNTTIALLDAAGNAPGLIRVAGDGSKFLFGDSSRYGESTLQILGGGDACFEQTGGETKSNFIGKRLSVYIGQENGQSGVLKISGGTFDMGYGATNGLMRVGMKGSGQLIVSGGSIVGCAKIELTERGNDGSETTSHYRQTGGYVEAVNGLTCNNASSANRHAVIELLGGVLSAYRLSGGAAVGNPTADRTDFYANGGTLRGGLNHKTYPFIYGFNCIKLGPKGLILDIKADANITQKFTDKGSETGRIFVMGDAGRKVYFDAPDGGDNSELVVGGLPVVYIDNVMTNWQTTAVVTNMACLNLSLIGNLSMKGLRLGNADSFGKVVLSPTGRLSLGTLEIENAEFNLADGFSAGSEYPLVTFKGPLTQDLAMALSCVNVSGKIPSGYTARVRCQYSREDDETTVVIDFVVPTSPAVANEWAGQSGAEALEWGDAGNWSAGIPSAESIVRFANEDEAVANVVEVSGLLTPLGALSFSSLRNYLVKGDGSLFFENCGVDAAIEVTAGDHRIDVPVGAAQKISVSVANGASLTFGKNLYSAAGELHVNPNLENGRVILDGEGSSFAKGITHRGGILEVASAEAFGQKQRGYTYNFKGYAMLRVGGSESDPAYRLPFGFYATGGSAANTSWGSANVVDTDRQLVVPPYVKSYTGGACLVKFGKSPLVFETSGETVLDLAIANGPHAWKNYALPDEPAFFVFDENTGKAGSSRSYGGVSVFEGALVYRGVDEIEPTVSSQAIKDGFGMLIGFGTTNTVDAAPGLVLDRVYADFGSGDVALHSSAHAPISYVSIAQDAYDAVSHPYPRAATNAYLVVSNGSTLATGHFRVGATTVSKNFLDVSPKITVDRSTLRATANLDFSARDKVHAEWNIDNDSVLLTGTNKVVWAGEANVSLAGASTMSGALDGTPTTIDLGAKARGVLSVAEGSQAKIGEVTASDGADVEFCFDGGKLLAAEDGNSTIQYPAAVTLSAGEEGLLIDVPQGKTWTLANDVKGPGCVTLAGDGVLALSGLRTAGFAGNGTVRGGTLVDGRIKVLPLGQGEGLTFDGTQFSGPIKVDLGLGEGPLAKPYPQGVKVAKFVGNVPPASSFRRYKRVADESGRSLTFKFTEKDGTVYADVTEQGLYMIVR